MWWCWGRRRESLVIGLLQYLNMIHDKADLVYNFTVQFCHFEEMFHYFFNLSSVSNMFPVVPLKSDSKNRGNEMHSRSLFQCEGSYEV